MRIRECFTFDLSKPVSFRPRLVFRLILDPSYKVVVSYRIASALREIKAFRLLGKLILVRISKVPGVEINTKYQIGKGFSIQHAHDIVIGYGAVLKENVTIYNGVTLGANYLTNDSDTATPPENRYPTICNNVIIFPGAKVIGNITIGAGSIIGANSVVLDSFEEKSIIAGNPAKKVGTRKVEVNEAKN